MSNNQERLDDFTAGIRTQSVYRLLMTAGFAVYVFYGMRHGVFTVESNPMDIVVLTALASVILLIFSHVSPLRTAVGAEPIAWAAMSADIFLLAVATSSYGVGAAVTYPIFLWVIIGNGVRYGVLFLRVGTGMSVVAFLLAIQSDQWADLRVMGVTLAVGLLIVPGYLQRLLGNLNAALEEAQASAQAKARFLANMSHELRTPLNGVVAAVDLMSREEVSPRVGELIKTATDSADVLLGMIKGVLDLSKAEAGNYKLDYEEEGSIHDIIRMACQTLAPLADKQSIALTAEIDSALLSRARLPAQELRQVFINLAGNAVKFTREGGVTIRGIDKGAFWRFEIVDTGIGMDDVAVQRMFEPFVQADDSIVRQFGGTGLGTTLSRQWIEQMGGKIGAYSEIGEGTTVWFEIPVEQTVCSLMTRSKGVEYLPASVSSDTSAKLAALGWSESRDSAGIVVSEDGDVDTIAAQAPGCGVIVSIDDAGIVGVVCSACRAVPYFRLSQSDLARYQAEILLYADGVKHADSSQTGIRSGLSYLVADDNEVNRRLLSGMLEVCEGLRLDVCEDGLQAVEMSRNHHYDVVLMDLNMPGLDGISAAQTIREDQSGAVIGIITADATSEVQSLAQSAGVDFVLTKPLRAAQLYRKVSTLLEPDKLDYRVEITVLPDVSPVQGDRYLDTSFLGELEETMRNGREFIITLAEAFVRDIETAGVVLLADYGDRDYTHALETAHGIKGSARQVGATRLAKYCDDLKKLRRRDFTPDYFDALAVEYREIEEHTIKSVKRYLVSLRESDTAPPDRAVS